MQFLIVPYAVIKIPVFLQLDVNLNYPKIRGLKNKYFRMKKIVILRSFFQTQIKEGRVFPPQKQLSCSYPINCLHGGYTIFFSSIQLHGSYNKLFATAQCKPTLLDVKEGEGGYCTACSIDIMSQNSHFLLPPPIFSQLPSCPPLYSIGGKWVFNCNLRTLHSECNVNFRLHLVL